MAKKSKKFEISEETLYAVIALLLLVISMLAYWLYEAEFKVRPVYQSVETVYNGAQINPIPVVKPEGVLRAEEDLRIVRNVSEDEDGYILVETFIKNLPRLDEEILLQDMVETLRFEERVELEDGEVAALSGRLFPQGKSINLATWGTGPQSQKKTKINVTVLDLNLDSSIKDSVGLYTLKFKPSAKIKALDFDPVEFRYGEFIMSFGEERLEI